MIVSSTDVRAALRARQRGFLLNPFRFGAGGGGGGSDPNFADVVLLAHGEGANNGTSILDSSSYNRACTAGGTVTSTEQALFGSASLKRVSGAQTSWAASTDFAFAAGQDFTIEMAIRLPSVPANAFFLARANSASANRWALGTSGSRLAMYHVGSSIAQDAGAFPSGAFVRVAVCRSGSTLRLFRDGAVVATVGDTRNYTDTSALTLFSGTAGDLTCPNGTYIDELRVTRAARYTAAFTPPAAAFPDA